MSILSGALDFEKELKTALTTVEIEEFGIKALRAAVKSRATRIIEAEQHLLPFTSSLECNDKVVWQEVFTEDDESGSTFKKTAHNAIDREKPGRIQLCVMSGFKNDPHEVLAFIPNPDELLDFCEELSAEVQQKRSEVQAGLQEVQEKCKAAFLCLLKNLWSLYLREKEFSIAWNNRQKALLEKSKELLQQDAKFEALLQRRHEIATETKRLKQECRNFITENDVENKLRSQELRKIQVAALRKECRRIEKNLQGSAPAQSPHLEDDIVDCLLEPDLEETENYFDENSSASKQPGRPCRNSAADRVAYLAAANKARRRSTVGFYNALARCAVEADEAKALDCADNGYSVIREAISLLQCLNGHALLSSGSTELGSKMKRLHENKLAEMKIEEACSRMPLAHYLSIDVESRRSRDPINAQLSEIPFGGAPLSKEHQTVGRRVVDKQTQDRIESQTVDDFDLLCSGRVSCYSHPQPGRKDTGCKQIYVSTLRKEVACPVRSASITKVDSSACAAAAQPPEMSAFARQSADFKHREDVAEEKAMRRRRRKRREARKRRQMQREPRIKRHRPGQNSVKYKEETISSLSRIDVW